MAREDPHFRLRIPSGIKAAIEEAAARNQRSITSEIVHRLAGDDETLRDKFAMAVLTGLCGNPGGPFQASEHSGWEMINCGEDDIADIAYHLADAMLAARKGGA